MTTAFGGRFAQTYTCHPPKLADPERKFAISSRRPAPESRSSTVSGVQDASRQSTAAKPELNRREAILATGGILAASACQPSSSLATQQPGASKGFIQDMLEQSAIQSQSKTLLWQAVKICLRA
jgi:hypothetical protein